MGGGGQGLSGVQVLWDIQVDGDVMDIIVLPTDQAVFGDGEGVIPGLQGDLCDPAAAADGIVPPGQQEGLCLAVHPQGIVGAENGDLVNGASPGYGDLIVAAGDHQRVQGTVYRDGTAAAGDLQSIGGAGEVYGSGAISHHQGA